MNKIPAVIFGLVFVLVAALSAVNPTNVAFNLFSLAITLPVGALLIAGFVIGSLTCFSSLSIIAKHKQLASTKALTKWDAEDQKLQLQVQTDREKQLEAKIATLETALQKA